MKTLTDKIAVVAGASRGIGRAVAITLARHGCDVALLARDREALCKTASEVNMTGRQALVCAIDMANWREVQQAVEQIQATFGIVDILYNGVAGALEDNIYNAEPGAIANFVQTTLTGSIWLTQALLPLMQRPGAHIINIITDWAMPNTCGPSTFVAGKYGVLGFGQALSKEVLAQGVRVTNILPGDVASDLSIHASVAEVTEKYGISKIPLSDLVEVIVLILRLDLAKIDQIIITPADPQYG
jgi:NADP-dependent 3-hydroxy acid dehydrogenase YdfG